MHSSSNTMNSTYTPAVDILVLRGWQLMAADPVASAQSNEYADELTELAAHLDLAENIGQGIARLENRAGKAVARLNSPELLDLAPDSELLAAEEALLREQAFEDLWALDDVLSLHMTLACWDFPQQFDQLGEWLARVSALHHGIMEADFLSGYRLIPINTMRNERLDMIRPEFHLAFPWYLRESDHHEASLEAIIDFLTNDPDRPLPLSLEELYARIKAGDPELARHIAVSVRANNLVEAVFRDAHQERWLLAAQEEANQHPVSPSVHQAGLLPAAVRLVCDLVLHRPSLEWRFLTAFCGPGLSDAQRLAVFDRVRNEIDTDLSVTSESWILSEVNSCRCNRIPAADLARTMFSEWMPKLEEKAGQLLATDERLQVSEDLLARLLAMSDEEAKTHARALFPEREPVEGDPGPLPDEGLLQQLQDFMGSVLHMQWQPAMGGGADKHHCEIEEEKNLFVASVPEILTDDRLGTCLKLVEEKENNSPAFQKIWQGIHKAASSFYWRCVVQTNTKTVTSKCWEKNALPVIVPSRLMPEITEDIQAILLGLSFKKKCLGDALFTELASFFEGKDQDASLDNLKISEIVWFLYVKSDSQHGHD